MTALSIVILSWNQGALLRQCLLALHGARVPEGTELILLDNGSTDPDVHKWIDDAVENWMPTPKVRRYTSNLKNEAYNLASDLYEGDNILLVNTDCFVRPDTIARMLAAKSPTNDWSHEHGDGMARAGVVGAQLLYENGRVQHGGVTLDRTTRLPFHRGRWGMRSIEWPLRTPEALPGVTGALVMYDRQCWTELGGLGPEFPLYYTDIDFCLRAWEAGWATVYAEDAIATHLEGASHLNPGALPEGFLEQQAAYLAKWGPNRPLPAAVHRMVYG